MRTGERLSINPPHPWFAQGVYGVRAFDNCQNGLDSRFCMEKEGGVSHYSILKDRSTSAYRR